VRFYSARREPGSAWEHYAFLVPEETWTVPLPAGVTEPYEVFVNGVRQEPGVDYSALGDTLFFSKPLAREGRLGLLRWASMFFGVAGTYRKNDSVDVVYEAGGRRVVASGLPIIPPGGREQSLSS
jgi:hypothetical protein